jgi:hypothetical protein
MPFLCVCLVGLLAHTGRRHGIPSFIYDDFRMQHPKLIDHAKLKKYLNKGAEDDDSIGFSDSQVLRFAYGFIKKNFKNLELRYSCVDDNGYY